MITLNKDDNDSNIESYCVTNNARQPRVCMRKKQNKYLGKKSVRKAKTRPKQPKSGLKGQKETNGPFLPMCLCFFFLIHTRGCFALLVTQ